MPIFKYKAKKLTGEETQGTKEVSDKSELAADLREQGYILISAESEEKIKKINFLVTFILSIANRVSLADKMIFSRNLSVMLSAGLPISRALTALSRQTPNKRFKQIIAEIEANIQKGEPLSTAISRRPEVFSNLFTAMVKAGERSGKLAESLIIISQQLERDLTLTRRVRGAMMYPMIILIAMVGIGILMMYLVVPTLLSVFKELNVELPFITQIIIFISNALINNPLLVILTGVILAAAALWALRSKKGQQIIDTALLHAPLFSPIVKKINSSRTTRTLSSLISSGVDITEAFEVAKNVVQNHHYQKILEQAKDEIQKGSPIAKVFIAAENLYPPLVGEMIAVGEETGQLPQMLLRLADFYEEEVEAATKNLTTVIEPILMIFIGATVGFFAVSMIQPMYSMLGGL